ncbi:MAG: hypothetical protein AB1779_05940 [Candidatus Thermoplasmatota archaeon]
MPKPIREEEKKIERVVEIPLEEKEEISERISELKEKVKEFEEKMKSGEAMGADISLATRYLTLAKSHFKRGNVEYVEKYLKRAENSLESAIFKIESEKGKLNLVRGIEGRCFACRKKITSDMAVLKCSCGSLFHEDCAGGFENCPNCLVDWEEV